MASRTDLLISSLQESLKLIQTYMVAGLGGGLFFALLVETGAKQVQMQAPAVGSSLPIPTSIAIAISLSAYWAAGAMASVLVERASRIALVLKSVDRELASAALSYPAIPTLRSHGPRLFLSIVPAISVVYGAVAYWRDSLWSYWPAFGVLVLVLPYLVLAYELRRPVGGEDADLWQG